MVYRGEPGFTACALFTLERVPARREVDGRGCALSGHAGQRRWVVQRFHGRACLRLLQFLGLRQPFSVLESHCGRAVSTLARALYRAVAPVPRKHPILFWRERLARPIWPVAHLPLGRGHPASVGISAEALALFAGSAADDCREEHQLSLGHWGV